MLDPVPTRPSDDVFSEAVYLFLNYGMSTVSVSFGLSQLPLPWQLHFDMHFKPNFIFPD